VESYLALTRVEVTELVNQITVATKNLSHEVTAALLRDTSRLFRKGMLRTR
jgi:hypothetical protein